MTRTDRAGRVIAALPATVYGALLDREALETWLPPEGMRGRIERWDPRPGGGFRMVLTYLDPTDSPGKTSEVTDVVDVGFVDLVPPERVVQRAVFEADDPSYAGTMTMSWHLAAAGGGTEVTVAATDVPPGISQADHEAGIASSLANLASYVEALGRLEPAAPRPGPEGGPGDRDRRGLRDR
ncbi:SRPBCC family protein [Streptomyces sp. NPDC057429]|uniref:SRPBCC family protein n=1 Tax=Streptomyces sp. NPDC057429 TaxID=3346130 RepID=UPI003678DDB6